MACNCKKAIDLNENYGEKVEYTPLSKVGFYLKKTLIVSFVLAGIVVLTPLALVYVMISVLFGKDRMVVLPKALAKYTVRKDGQKLQS